MFGRVSKYAFNSPVHIRLLLLLHTSQQQLLSLSSLQTTQPRFWISRAWKCFSGPHMIVITQLIYWPRASKCSQRNLIFSSSFPKLGNRELAKQLESHLPTNVNSSSFEAREYKRYTSSIGHIEESWAKAHHLSLLSSQPYTLKRKPEITSDRCLQSKDPFLSL